MTPRPRTRPSGRARSGPGPLHAFAVLGAALAAAWAGPARAEPVQAVVELFTSQGCGPCRSAEPVIRDLSRQPGVLALTLPVTYWDYLGWKDTLARRTFNARQRDYARVHGGRSLFTPQAVIDGTDVALGSDRQALDRLVREAAQPGGLPVPVHCEARADRIVVEIGAAPADAGPGKGEVDTGETSTGEVWLVPVARDRPVAVQSGDNGGRTVTYVNVARGLERLGPWTGKPERFDVPRSLAEVDGADGWAVLVQSAVDGKPGRIVGAGKGPSL